MENSTILVELGFGCYGITNSDRELLLKTYLETLPVAVHITQERNDG